MKNTIKTLVLLLTLLLSLVSAVSAAETATGQLYHLRLNHTAIATDASSVRQPEIPIDVLEQVASLFNGDRGLTISESTSIILLCNQLDPLDDPNYQPEVLDNLGIGLKIKF